MKKWVLLIIFTALVLIILATRPKSNNDELVFWTLQMRDFSSYMEKVIANFEAENPEIKIKWVDIPFSEGEKRTLAAILSDTPPDLVNLNPDFSALLAQKGTLTEICDEDLTQFPQEIVNNMKFNGKNYFIPWYATSALTFYNKKLLPNPPKNYNEIFARCHTGVNKPLLMFNFAENDSMLKLLNKYGINSPETINSQLSIDLFRTIQEAYASGCFPKESLTQTHRESLEKFMAEEVLMFEGGSNFLNLIKENAPKTYTKIALAPQLTGETGKYNFSMMNFIIPIKSKKQTEALKFALFLTNEENQLELAKLTNILAVNKDALKNEFYTKADGDIFAQARVLSAKQLKNIQPQPFYAQRKELITLINNATQKILLKQDAIENVLNKLKSDWIKLY
ncbi:MAG: extracellular solute-binding protein [Fusobacterium sp.]|nr:extracellular solute-binding protein [Fusobacterium sp.]